MSKAYDLHKMMTISDMAYAILMQSKKPLHYKEIFKEIRKVKQVKNSGSVQSCIYSQELFIRIGGGYWGLKKWLLNGLSFVYCLSSSEYKKGILKINYDYEFYFPQYIKRDVAKFKIQDREYNCPRKNKQVFTVDNFYQVEEFYPGDKMIIKIANIDSLEYKIIKMKENNAELDLTDTNKQICELAYKVLEEKREIMNSSRLLEQILIKNLEEDIGENIDIGPLLPLSKILNSDDRFKEKLPGMFTLNA